MEGLTEGRIVHYVLTDQDTVEINRRRVPGAGHSKRWSTGAQAHVGNPVEAGNHVPMMVVAVWGTSGDVNGQCFLDGNDSFWVTDKMPDLEAKLPGTWHWIEKA